MTRITYIEPHFTNKEIKTRYRKTLDSVESRRWYLLWLVSQSWTIKQAAQAVGINYDYAKNLVKTQYGSVKAQNEVK